MANKKAPELRFKGFTDDWEQRKLSEITEVMDGDRGNNYPSSNDFKEEGHTLFLSATNVTKSGLSFENNQYITEEKSNYLGNGKLKTNDIILTSRGSIGNIAWYNNNVACKIPYARINSGMLILRSGKQIEASYLAQYLKAPIGKRQIDYISFGSAQPQLTKKDVSSYRVIVPCIQEQVKLGFFFIYIDNTITLHQRKLEQLQVLKQAYLQQMFPSGAEQAPKLRFAKFSNKWERRYVKDIFNSIESGNRLPKSGLVDGDVPYVVATVTDNGILKRIDKNTLDYHGNKMKLFSAPSITFSIDNPEAIFIQNESFFTSNIMRVLHNSLFSIEEYNFYKVSIENLKTFYNWSLKFSGPVVMNSVITVSKNQKETKMIGGFIKKLDNQITLHQQKLDQLTNLKSAYLQQMFI